jgi:hypothetical protein
MQVISRAYSCSSVIAVQCAAESCLQCAAIVYVVRIILQLRLLPSHISDWCNVYTNTMQDFAHHSGAVAGLNMAAAASSSKQHRRSSSSSAQQQQQQYCYRQVPVFSGAVPAAGVRLWLVGDCDAAHETHGYWWSNPSLARAGTASIHCYSCTLLNDMHECSDTCCGLLCKAAT